MSRDQEEALSKLAAALKLIEDGDALLWDVRMLAESIEFTTDFFNALRDLERKQWDIILELRGISTGGL